jgi:sulfite reductase alpha subunit-like flavoprotein
VGPLAGFVRANTQGRPVHLYFGGRSPASDFLYEHEFAQHLVANIYDIRVLLGVEALGEGSLQV